jgi:four helix bundle protein
MKQQNANGGPQAKARLIVQSFRDLEVYQGAMRFQQRIFDTSKRFPKDEMYSLTSQVRRSSRSIGSNLAEAWAKRRYSAHFLSKLTDADGELQETFHWIETAMACGYLTQDQFAGLIEEARPIGAKLGKMIANYEKFCHS